MDISGSMLEADRKSEWRNLQSLSLDHTEAAVYAAFAYRWWGGEWEGNASIFITPGQVRT